MARNEKSVRLRATVCWRRPMELLSGNQGFRADGDFRWARSQLRPSGMGNSTGASLYNSFRETKRFVCIGKPSSI